METIGEIMAIIGSATVLGLAILSALFLARCIETIPDHEERISILERKFKLFAQLKETESQKETEN